MDDFTHPVEPAQGLLNSPVLVIIAQHALVRTSILSILKRELAGFEIVEMATTSGPSWLSGRDIRLIALNIGDKEITDPAIEGSLAFLAEFCPNAAVALLSNRDDEATALELENPTTCNFVCEWSADAPLHDSARDAGAFGWLAATTLAARNDSPRASNALEKHFPRQR